ncbi:MAG: polynucleotide adenylyltransferase PcnB [Thermoanaerobaculia bacterium]
MSIAPTSGPRILARPDHPVSRRHIASNAIKVLYRLHRAGFKAYLVGGAVRDLMMERPPKDFDVSTDARPQQVRKLFRNSRIIGRRFRLAHVFFRDGIVEVSTFRRNPDPEAQESAPGELLITDDNVYGTPEEDAFRRDFTVNALFYNVADFSVIDYVGGIEDLEEGLIRAIGDPAVRFREDPVRMLRACELAGRLGFQLEEGTRKAVRRHRSEIEKASPARLTEELIQLLRCAAAAPAFQMMLELGLLETLLPEAYLLLRASQHGAGEFEQILPALDRMVRGDAEFSDAGLLSILLLPKVLLRRRDVETMGGGRISRAALGRLTSEAVVPFLQRFGLSRARAEQIQQALWAFHRLGEPWRTAAQRIRFAGSPGFDDAFHLLEILVEATGQGGKELGIWREIRRRRPQAPSAGPTRRRRRRRRRR